MPSAFIERSFIRSLVSEPDNCFALFYFVINADISHVIMTLIRYFLIQKSRDSVSHNPGISGLKKGPGSRDPGIRDPGIAIPSYVHYMACINKVDDQSDAVHTDTQGLYIMHIIVLEPNINHVQV